MAARITLDQATKAMAEADSRPKPKGNTPFLCLLPWARRRTTVTEAAWPTPAWQMMVASFLTYIPPNSGRC